MKSTTKLNVSRAIMLIVPILIQFILLGVVLVEFSSHFVWFYALNVVLSIIFTLVIIKDDSKNPAYKLAWIVPILIVPVFGVILYILFGGIKDNRKVKKIVSESDSYYRRLLHPDKAVDEEIRSQSAAAARQVRYLENSALFPAYRGSTVEYFPSGEAKWARLLEELQKAEHYIFLEYFIIREGEMWNSILDILRKKAAAGVDVRVVYDDMGSLFTLPGDFSDSLKQQGIKCMPFNRCVPFLSVIMNNRDHRKIVVIDGHTAFTGGINLSDEYVNITHNLGHWKDTALMIKGEAVWSFTVMFLSLWSGITGISEPEEHFYPHEYHRESFTDDGFVLPYSDSPLDREAVGQTAYLNMINSAKNYLYINTPYLIPDNEVQTALCNAAKSGVDVRILTPHIPDKKIIFMLTRSHYEPLIRAGVKIYEYTPGFVHAKSFVADDEQAIVGTINLDFRSLYLHFECAAWLYGCRCIGDIKEDFLQTLEKSELIDEKRCREIVRRKGLLMGILKLFSPLM